MRDVEELKEIGLQQQQKLHHPSWTKTLENEIIKAYCSGYLIIYFPIINTTHQYFIMGKLINDESNNIKSTEVIKNLERGIWHIKIELK